MIKWICSICGAEANYHTCDGKEHKYYCDKHWEVK
jgi:hypothetical protein